jgi:hypothetical protein
MGARLGAQSQRYEESPSKFHAGKSRRMLFGGDVNHETFSAHDSGELVMKRSTLTAICSSARRISRASRLLSRKRKAMDNLIVSTF